MHWQQHMGAARPARTVSLLIAHVLKGSHRSLIYTLQVLEIHWSKKVTSDGMLSTLFERGRVHW